MSSLPKSWNELVFQYGSQDQSWWNLWLEITALPQPKTHILFQKTFSSYLKDGAFDKLTLASWRDLILFFAAQTALVQKHQVTQKNIYSTTINRNFNQLPCTEQTLQNRVKSICARVSPEKKILILGDDDYVSLELYKKGYQNIVVIDIDKQVINKIKKNSSLKCFVHDLQQPIQEIFIDHYDFITFDCPYSLKGFLLFFLASLKINTNPAPQYLVNMSLLWLHNDYSSFLNELSNYQFKISDYELGANAYPTTKTMNSSYRAGKFLLKLFIDKKYHPLYPENLKFLSSDALWLEKHP